MTIPLPAPRHGAHPIDATRTRFGLWAPQAETVQITVDDRRSAMNPDADGWWSLTTEAAHGSRYAYHLDGADPLPDPAARWLPDGVHAPAAVLDITRLPRRTRSFRPVPLSAAVIYELHVGTFTAEGTFAAAAEHLPDLVDLGVTHIEVMPVNAFDGAHNWGYDGVAWWATHQGYGGPEALAAFVDACHDADLAVVLDVVHNHLGPSGNYLSRFGPYLQSGKDSTWGEAVNLDGPDSGPVREFILGNALQWLADFGVDALRLDAVHALVDDSPVHLLAELSDRTRDLAESLGRPLTLIAETDRNDPQALRPRLVGGLGLDGQWADDLHHAIHGAVTGEADGYYADYADPLPAIAAAYTGGFVYDGSRHSTFRGRVVGAPLPPDVSSRQLIACIQNHDQVGNRAAGDRLTTLVEPDLVRVAIALLCLAPHTPMIFMGEEYGEARPFQFFSDMPGDALRQAIRDGRRREFEYFSSWQGEVPDPLDHATVERSTLDRSAAATDAGHQRRALWKDLLALRRTQPALAIGRRDLVHAHVPEGAGLLIVQRRPSAAHPAAPHIVVTANLSDRPTATMASLVGLSACARPTPTPDTSTGPSHTRVPPIDISAHPVLLSTADSRYGGPGQLDDARVPARSVIVHAVPPTDISGT